MRDNSFFTETSRTVQLKKRVICFGDSNTYGVVAKWQQDGKPSDRYNEITRWPRVMQSCLGKKWEAIEEGMPGRTTIYSNISEDEDRHNTEADPSVGINYLLPCLLSHWPYNEVILALGVNDLQVNVHKEPVTEQELYNGMRKLAMVVLSMPRTCEEGWNRHLYLMAPAPVAQAEGRLEVTEAYGGERGIALSRSFPGIYRKLSEELGCGFIDAGCVAAPDKADGVHYTAESHIRLGKYVASRLRSGQEHSDWKKP